ncbi:MAG TPA: nuclear transport factor 2 family protein [Verrucomicrobiae bacterium]|nr:nuclear transport factor 2 family protein [Verrucomicrobiae bacterium]
MKWLMRIVVVALVAFLVWQVWQRVFVTDETRVRRLLSTMVSAVEKGDVFRLSDAMAADYSDDWGTDKSTVIGGVHAFRAQYDAIFIHLSDLTVTVEPNHQKAQAVFIAKIIAKAKGSLTDSEVRADRFRLYFRKDDAGWKLIRAESPELKFD